MRRKAFTLEGVFLALVIIGAVISITSPSILEATKQVDVQQTVSNKVSNPVKDNSIDYDFREGK